MVSKDLEQRMEKEVVLAGYTDRLSGRPGQTIQFHVSCTLGHDTGEHEEKEHRRMISAKMTRSICADPNPAGPGIIEQDASQWFPPTEFPARHQPIHGGSFARTQYPISTSAAEVEDSIHIDIWIYSTGRACYKGPLQCVWSWGDVLGLYLNPSGGLIVSSPRNGGVDQKAWILATTDDSFSFSLRRWYQSTVILDRQQNQCSIEVTTAKGVLVYHASKNYEVAGFIPENWEGYFELASAGTFNGKLESPQIHTGRGKALFQWNTSQNISGWSIPSTTSNDDADAASSFSMSRTPPLILYNHPARGVKGVKWDGTEFCWKHAPEQYAAIYFHDDDIYDFGWESDYRWTIPEGIPSGIYIVHLSVCDDKDDGQEYRESLPLFVCPPSQTMDSTKLCVLISTFTYVMYGNHARSDFDEIAWTQRVQEWSNGAYPHNPAQYPRYGYSTYNAHSSDGVGIHLASHRRPLFNLRPGFLTFGHTTCSGLRHFPADSHLIAYLHHCGIDYDIVTDHELHQEGVEALTGHGYTTLVTGSHPEYHSLQTLNALQDFRDVSGGNLMYMGGNGFYWRVTASSTTGGTDHPTQEPPSTGFSSITITGNGNGNNGSSSAACSLLEIRRAEDGVRTWAAEPGEYYHALGTTPLASYGGLWRRNHRPPQQLVGVGFAAQGSFIGMPYHPQRTSYNDPTMAWIWKGVFLDDGDGDGDTSSPRLLGDFGFSGGGAAGFELDRMDRALDGDDHAVHILAQAYGPASHYMYVPEEVLTTYSNLSGLPEEEARRADMVYFQTTSPSRSQVFSVGSITFCGSLPWNSFDNSIATLVRNVLRRFLGEDENE